MQRFKRDLNLCFSIFKWNFSDSALFQRAAAARFRINRRKIFHKVMGAGLLVFTNQVQRLFALKKGATDWRLEMSEENTPQKERFLREVEQQLLRKELDAKLLEDGLIHIRWKEKPLCSVDRDGIVRFRPADITGPEVDRQLRTVIQAAGQVKEYMRIFERAPALKAVGLEDTYKVLADFGDAVLAGQLGKKGARFVTWEWDFDRQGVHVGHYFMENYEAAKKDFAVRAGLVESQRLFSDEQLAVIRDACEFALEDDATLSYAEEKQLQSVQEQIELLLPQEEQEQRSTMEQTM
ncbi:MAG: hypothetical protein DBX57_05240 [Clostridia bacterium]|nr:MAG: hypothetical protein DBX57_05240 [Clostridia bacterium]